MSVNVGNMVCQAKILFQVGLIEDEEQEIKSRQESSREVDVLQWTLPGIIPSIGWIGSSQNGSSGIQGRADSCL